MASSDPPSSRKARPQFMVTLGVLPPYSLDDVKRAYLTKIRTAHPDHGGEIGLFRRIQEAYEEAQVFLKFRTEKRSWIAAQMDRYVALSDLKEQLTGFGAIVEDQHTGWLERSYGDFSELTSHVEAIRLGDVTEGEKVANLLVDNYNLLSRLKRLELTCCQLTDDAALPLARFQLLEKLNLSGNPITRRVTSLADAIPTLKELDLSSTEVGSREINRIARRLRKRSSKRGPLLPL